MEILRDELYDIILTHCFVTDGWGGSQLADWEHGYEVVVDGIDEAVDAILSRLALLETDAAINNQNEGQAVATVQQKRNMSKWIRVIDAMPAEGERVIGYDKFCDRVGEAVITPWNKSRLHFIDDDDCSITHWQHFPKAPRPTLREPDKSHSHPGAGGSE